MSGVYGRVQIRKSDDCGRSWTSPASDTTGILSETGYHTAPTPMAATATTLYRAVEDIAQGGGWPAQFRAHVMSATLTRRCRPFRHSTETPKDFAREERVCVRDQRVGLAQGTRPT